MADRQSHVSSRVRLCEGRIFGQGHSSGDFGNIDSFAITPKLIQGGCASLDALKMHGKLAAETRSLRLVDASIEF